jgi:branched-chain amino acid transport system permease protein
LFVSMLVVGGLGTFAGPMVGTAVIMIVSEYLRDYQEARLIILGLILLLTIVIAPRGLVPALQDGWARVQRWMSEDETTERAEEAATSREPEAREPSDAPVSTKGER